MASTREMLRLLPFGARTGLGSLPHTGISTALWISFGHELPFLPQLPGVSPAELMLPAALEGLPGLKDDATIDVDAWRSKRDGFSFAIEGALASKDLTAFEPVRQACFRPFLAEVERRKPRFAKVEIAGPATARWCARTTAGEAASENAELDQQIFRLLLARSLALVQAVRRTGAVPILFLDEPGLIALDPATARHGRVLQELELLIHAAQDAGALVGIHCCGNTQWSALLGLGLDILSFDARLSLDAILEEKAACLAFLDGGSTFAIGLIPTHPNQTYAVDELVDATEVSIRATLPRAEAVLGRLILTPACGLGERTIADADRIIAEVGHAQRRLRALVGLAEEAMPLG